MMCPSRSFSVSRRAALFALLPLGAALVRPGASWAAAPAPVLEAAFAPIEARTGGRLGVSALDGGGRVIAAYRAAERFPLCSTFKLLLAAAVLARVDEGRERLERRITFSTADLIAHSPVTQKRVAEGMSIAGLCEATVTVSDNAAANLLLAALGGPEQVTLFARALGDEVTRLDRWEPALNSALPGDPRDTTTPEAMARDIHRLIVGTALKPESRFRLREWLIGCKTGDARLRAGLPGWEVGDKTGTGENGTFNDVGFARRASDRPETPPLTLAVYLTGSSLDTAGSSAAIAEAARVIGAAAAG